MKHSRRRLIDLRKRASRPLVVRRAEKMRANLLRLEKVSARKSVKGQSRRFDLARDKKKSPQGALYLPADKSPRRNFGRFKIAAAAIALVFVLNLAGIFGSGKSTVERTVATAFSGIGDLIAASESLAAGDFTNSQNQFAEAVEILRSAEEDLMVLGGAGAILETQPENVQAGSRLVSAGKLLASGGEKFAEAANTASSALSNWKVRQQARISGEQVESFSAQLREPITEVLSGLAELENAAAILSLVETDVLPDELAGKVIQAQRELNRFLELVRPLADTLPAIPDLLGDRVPRRYLVLFQNQTEIRATGGFIGSIGILDLDDGFVKNFEIKNVYEIDGQITQHFDPPEGYEFITGSWGLRDSNFHPDFPTSAAAAEKLFESAGFGSVDGVAAVNASFLEKLVDYLGGIKLERYSRKISAAELTLLLSLVIETKIDGAENPKIILNELWTALRDRLEEIPPNDLVALAWQAIKSKEFQFASNNQDFLKFARAAKIANELPPTAGDYLFVVNTSLSGNKSDRFTKNTITHTTEIDSSGATTDTIKILRQHSWSESYEHEMENLAAEFGIRLTDNLKEILGRGRNIDLIKIFVPSGSELISVEGLPETSVAVRESAGKTVFQFSLTTQPKFSREVILKYQLPQKFIANYSFLGEFQSGDKTRSIEKTLKKNNTEIYAGTIPLGETKTWSF
ncbi:MAG: DUF4012 domain-containing protein [Candidatus Peribacteraceae bacterium]|nr:DUF4012 domain-containing protein [Candidatus Peribacteraceae bacterium]